MINSGSLNSKVLQNNRQRQEREREGDRERERETERESETEREGERKRETDNDGEIERYSLNFIQNLFIPMGVSPIAKPPYLLFLC